MNKKSIVIVDKWGYYGYKKIRRGGFFYVVLDYFVVVFVFFERLISSM